MTVKMNDIQAQLNTLSLMTTNPTRIKRKFYFWSCRSNFTRGNKTCLVTKTGHKEEAYYKKLLGVSEKGWKSRLGSIINKILISNPNTSLINCIGTPPNFPSKNTLAIVDADAKIHPEKQATTTMASVIISNDIKARLIYGITMKSSHTTLLRDNSRVFACWGDLILNEFKNQFCACSAQPGQKCEAGLLFNTKMPAVLRVVDCILVTMIKIKSMLGLLITSMP